MPSFLLIYQVTFSKAKKMDKTLYRESIAKVRQRTEKELKKSPDELLKQMLEDAKALPKGYAKEFSPIMFSQPEVKRNMDIVASAVLVTLLLGSLAMTVLGAICIITDDETLVARTCGDFSNGMVFAALGPLCIGIIWVLSPW